MKKKQENLSKKRLRGKKKIKVSNSRKVIKVIKEYGKQYFIDYDGMKIYE